ncbi:MAG: MBL fold metallo-hydrolase [Acidobacteria bacterium]|nr:MBL fold metallo-hydrolase [Acidobacteriota bacterium]
MPLLFSRRSALAMFAQSYLSSPRRALTAPELLDAPDEWITRSLSWVEDMLARQPQYNFSAGKLQTPEAALHRAALIRLDDVLHIDSAPDKALIHDWYRNRMLATAKRIANTKATVTKLYDHGWFVQTPSTRFAIDLVGGAPRNAKFQMSEEALDLFVKSADALFISHWHSDHADPVVARKFLAHNKPVVAPADVFRDEPDLQKRLTVPERSLTKASTFGKLSVIAFPGHQGKDVINNCYLFRSAEGLTIQHTGDQSNDDDFAWIDQIHKSHRVDIFLPNCWTPQPLRFCAGVKPKLILPGHENEMAHTVPHREDWTQTFTRFEGCQGLMLPLCWGEEVIYKP